LRPLAVFTRILRSLSDLRPPVPSALLLAIAGSPGIAARPLVGTIIVHERNKDAFAQATIGHAHAISWPFATDRLEYSTTGQDQISAILANAGMGHAAVKWHAHQRPHGL